MKATIWTGGLILFLSLWIPGELGAQGVGCNGRCLFFNGVPQCSLSFFGTNICHHGQDYCAEFACWGSTTPTDPTAPSDLAVVGVKGHQAVEDADSPTAPAQRPAQGAIRVRNLGPRT